LLLRVVVREVVHLSGPGRAFHAPQSNASVQSRHGIWYFRWLLDDFIAEDNPVRVVEAFSAQEVRDVLRFVFAGIGFYRE